MEWVEEVWELDQGENVIAQTAVTENHIGQAYHATQRNVQDVVLPLQGYR